MLTDKEARALRLKIADREGDIANAQRDIDAMRLELGEQPETPPVVVVPDVPKSRFPAVAGPLQVWNWTNAWGPSEWDEPKLSGYPWSSANAQLIGDDLSIKVTEKKSAQVQQNDAGLSTSARWDVDVTLAPQTPGLIQAPLWLYNKDTKDEIDFEYAGDKGLQLNVYAKGISVWGKVIKGDFKREELAVEYRAGKSIIFLANGAELDRVTPEMTKGNAFPASPMKALMEMWVSGAVGWAGAWKGAGTGLEMRIHGFKQTAL